MLSFTVFHICMLGLFLVGFVNSCEETNDNWLWFLEHLKQAIDTCRKLVFVSDRNHGIREGVKNVFLKCNHELLQTSHG